jgi:predicted ATP-grasp superfamily ATP-dependent carboligase
MKKKVLVFPCGSEIGLEIYNSVSHSIHFELYGLSSVKDHGEFVYENYIDGIGQYNSDNFIDELKKIIVGYKIDILYPTMDSVIAFLKYFEEELGIPVVGPSYEVAKICSSKLETYRLLKDKIRIPKQFSNNDKDLKFPLFVKPDIGYGSRNVLKINNIEQLKNTDLEGMILCEYLPGKEYTIDCFTDMNGDLLFVGARERSRTMNGISVNTKTSKTLTERFRSFAEIINSNVPFKGSWFFQLKLDSNGDPCLLEIACRFAGSSAVHRIKGANFALANLFLSTNINPVFIINDFEIESDRALNTIFKLNTTYDTIFIDYDDTIIIDGKVNLDAIKFIFQSINENKKIILITKHKGDIFKSLNHFKLSNLFDVVIHLNQNEEKTISIEETGYMNAIFIDDSFEERSKVHLEFNIPVFSVDCIKSLLI